VADPVEDWHNGYGITNAPLYFDGIVYSGITGGEFGIRGRLTALDAKTGKILWRAYTLPAAGEPGGDTWPAGTDHFSRGEPGLFAPLHDGLLLHGEPYMHLADLASYLEADRRLDELFARPDDWTRKAILNVAGSGRFSSDRAIAEYASEIWNVKPLPVA